MTPHPTTPSAEGTMIPGLHHSEPAHDWQAPLRIFDYREAANPIRPGLTDPIPLRQWPAAIHASGPTGIHPLDLSDVLGGEGPATSPALAAHFLRLLPGEGLKAAACATSSLFYVLRGRGDLLRPARGEDPSLRVAWGTGDVVVLPSGADPLLQASEESVLYWVHDEPLLRYLGVSPARPRFRPCHYPAAVLAQELDQLLRDPTAARSNRMSILLGNADLPATRTVSHTLWAMLGLVPAGAVQPPHRHQSVALDLVIDCAPGCHTLVGSDLDESGAIRDPRRVEWEPGGAFITPPGLWHAHVNPTGRPARLLPIQDAGLHTYLRSLDIRFAGGSRSPG